MKKILLPLLLILFLFTELNAKTSIVIDSTVTEINLEDTLIEKNNAAKEFTKDDIQNISSKAEEPYKAKLTWNLKYSSVEFIDSVVIRYKQKLLDSDPWKYKAVEASMVNVTLDNLYGGTEYDFQIGISKTGKLSTADHASNKEIVWSEKKKFKPVSGFGWSSILILIGSLGFFIYGMKIMSDGIQKIAGNKMRSILGAMTSSRVGGVFTGFTVTSVIQSSSATTVMIVSFVNAGLLSLVQAIGVIMGANIGTTITGWLVSFFGFKVAMSDLALPIIAIALPLLFSNKNKTKSVAEFMIGFALLFMGLDFLKNSMPDIKSNPEMFAFLSSYSGTGIGSILFSVLVGTLLTVVVQSSSAAMALTLVLCNQGYISFEMAAGIILGENIGTTITANLAAIIANIHAKRAALAHTVFNLFGVFWMVLVFPFALKAIDWYCLNYTNDGSPFANPEARPIALSIFHTGFNLINTFILVWFVGLIAKIVTKALPSRGKSEEEFHLEYINAGFINAPELAIVEAKKEVAKYGKITYKMSGMVQSLISERDQKKYNEILAKVKKYEEITDRLEIEIANYLSKVSENEISQEASKKSRAMISIANDLERIGDIYYQMAKVIERKNTEKIYFTPEQRNQLNEMFKVVDEAFELTNENLHNEYEDIKLDAAKMKETQINKLRNQLKQNHLQAIESGDYQIKNGQVYLDLVSYCEKVGDHLLNVSEAIAGEI